MVESYNSKVTIYTDGACKNNPGPGGWAAILISSSKEKIIVGSDPYTTNNRMELIAVINALNFLKHSCEVIIYTDSKYVMQGITSWLPNWRAKNWRTANGSPVKNQDLWEKLECSIQKHKVLWNWVKGHNGNLFNERVDFLAKQAIICDK